MRCVKEAGTHLDPIPHGREKRGRVHDRDRAQRLGIIRGRERGRLLEVRAERPERGQGDLLEVNDRGDGGDGRRRGAVRQVRAETQREAGHGLVKRYAGGEKRVPCTAAGQCR